MHPHSYTQDSDFRCIFSVLLLYFLVHEVNASSVQLTPNHMFLSSGIGTLPIEIFSRERGVDYVAILNLEILKGQHTTANEWKQLTTYTCDINTKKENSFLHETINK